MVQKKRISQQQVNLSGLFLAAVLILISAFLSSMAYEPQAGPIPRIETTGRSVTGFATSFTATCSDGVTIFRAAANSNSLAAPYNTADITTYSKKVCADPSLGSGHTCIYPTTTTTTGPAALPAHCSNTAWDADESDQDCGGSCNKCSSGLSCWGNSDCSSGMCWFDSATMTKRAGAGITKDQRLSPISTNIQYQGVCVNTAPSTGGIVGGAIADVTGETFGIPSSPSFGTPTAPSYCSDGSKSGDESDVDCGGSCFAKCGNNLKCVSGNDCLSSYCNNGVCQTQSISLPSAIPTAPTITTIPTTPITTTTPAAPINRIIRIGSDGTIEKVGYSGAPAATSTTIPVPGVDGTITTCSVYRTAAYSTTDINVYVNSVNAMCTPQAGPAGTKLLGIIDEYNDVLNSAYPRWYNAFAIYVSDNVQGEIIKCDPRDINNGCGNYNLPLEKLDITQISIPCTKGTLQAQFIENHGGYLNYFIYGVCADKKIKVASCMQNVKGRTCITAAPETGLVKFNGYFTDIQDATGARNFFYYDFYGEAATTKTTTVPSSTTYSDVCFGNGPYHYEDRTGKTKGACDAGNCIFTISADTGAKVADCSSNGYSTSVCSGGYCVGTDCLQAACQDQNSCNANNNCAWDIINKNCKNRGNICNKGGVSICTPAAFRSGDYSCLYKQGNYYTQACVGAGQFGFWQIPEVY